MRRDPKRCDRATGPVPFPVGCAGTAGTAAAAGGGGGADGVGAGVRGGVGGGAGAGVGSVVDGFGRAFALAPSGSCRAHLALLGKALLAPGGGGGVRRLCHGARGSCWRPVAPGTSKLWVCTLPSANVMFT